MLFKIYSFIFVHVYHCTTCLFIYFFFFNLNFTVLKQISGVGPSDYYFKKQFYFLLKNSTITLADATTSIVCTVVIV